MQINLWNVTYLEGKENELVREIEKYWLEIIWLTSTDSMGSGTQLERSWYLHNFEVTKDEWCWAGVEVFIVFQLNCHVEFTKVNETVASLRFRLRIGFLLLFVFTAQTEVQGSQHFFL